MRLLSVFFAIVIAFPLKAQLTGYVLDNYSQPVANAKITFINEQDVSQKYNVTADEGGYYNVTLLKSSELYTETRLFGASPNPFYYETAISFYLSKTGRVKLSIYNIHGQLIKVVEEASLPPQSYSYYWDGTHQNGSRSVAGVFFAVLETDGKRFVQKLMMVPTQAYASVGVYHELKSLSSGSYRVIISAENTDTLVLRHVLVPESNQLDFSVYRRVEVPFATNGDFIGLWNGTAFSNIFIKGINLGVSVPGTLPGELAATREQYTRWIKMIGDAGFNAIRVYTLHFPRFYQELALYNNAHPDNPIYLFQGIWLQEDTLNGNLYTYTEGFDSGIKEVIDCVHGKKTISERFGRAFGQFDADVSRWTIGYIIGREIHPYEVEMTDFQNSAVTNYEGVSLRLPNGTPTEAWLAERLDKLIEYEKQTYHVHRPVSVSSWPTFDPVEHPSENDYITDEDKFSFDLNNIDMYNAPAGYFASFHAYPYYPDFVNRDPDYQDDRDEEGPNAYLDI